MQKLHVDFIIADRAKFANATESVFARYSCGQIVAAFALFHVLVWTIVPVVSHAGLPMDVIEGYAFGKEWVIGTHKHPALPSWLLEGSRILTGAVGWPAYVLSGLFIGATYLIVYRLGAAMMDPQRALAGTLLLSGVLYFSWVTPEFNHNVALMPTWVALILALWKARESGRLVWWMAVGALAALGIFTKLATVVLLITAAAWILGDPKCRRWLVTPGPWVGLLTFLVLVSPMLNWMITTDFQILEYAEARARSGRAKGLGIFLVKHWAATLGVWVILIAAFARFWPATTRPDYPAAVASEDPDARPFLTVFLLAPLVLTLVMAALTGSGLKASWCAPMHSLIGLVAVLWLGDRMPPDPLVRRVTVGAAVLFVLITIVYVATSFWTRQATVARHRVSWPQKSIAAKIDAAWQAHSNRPLTYVVGDAWVGGIVTTFSKFRPSLLVDGRLDISPWVDKATFAREGGVIVWTPGVRLPQVLATGENMEPRVDGELKLGMPNRRKRGSLVVKYSFVSPEEAQAILAAPPPTSTRLKRTTPQS